MKNSSPNRVVAKIAICTTLGTIVTVPIAEAVYQVKTQQEITCTRVESILSLPQNKFRVITNDGRNFNINNSLFNWNQDEVLFQLTSTNDEISLVIYGWRSPILGLTPNIIQATPNPHCSQPQKH
jgi:hypothetical protein